MEALVTVLKFGDAAVVKITRFGVIFGMLTLFVLLMVRIIARTAEIPFLAYDEVGEFATVWMILLGVLAIWREGALYSVDFHVQSTSRAALFLNLLIQLVMLFFAAVLVWQGWKFTVMNREYTAFLRLNMDYYYGAIPTTAAVMAMYSLRAVGQRLAAIVTGRVPENIYGDTDADFPSGHL